MIVAVVILNWNGKEYIGKCLDSVLNLKTRDFKILPIVVDNASTDLSADFIEKNYPSIILLRNQMNTGFTGGNNVGVKYALEQGAEYVLILNPDTKVEENLLVSLIEVFQSNSKVGVVGPKIYFAPGFEYHKDRYGKKDIGKVFWYAGGQIDWKNVFSSHRGVDEVDEEQYDKETLTDFVSGCALFAKSEVFSKVGLLDDNYFLYWEDVDFCQRVKNSGWEVKYVPVGKVWHMNAGSSGVGGSLQDYYLSRNRLLFGLKYAPLRTKVALVRESFKLLVSGRTWQRKGILDYFMRNLGKGSYK